MFRALSLSALGALFMFALLAAFRCDYQAARVTERLVLERAPQIRALYSPFTPSAEDCRAQGKQWVAYRNPDQWSWTRECVDARIGNLLSPH